MLVNQKTGAMSVIQVVFIIGPLMYTEPHIGSYMGSQGEKAITAGGVLVVSVTEPSMVADPAITTFPPVLLTVAP